MKPAFSKIVKTSRSGLIYWVKAIEKSNNLPAWYYIQLENNTKAAIFTKHLKNGLNLRDYGSILYSGWGNEPPEDIKQKIQEQFG